jgi:torulene dioxygenase
MLLNGSALSSMTWVDGAPTWFHVFGRKQEGLVASIPGPAFFTFHVANAFDTINQTTGDVSITLDSASFNEGNIMQQLHNFGTPHRKGPKSETVTSTTKLNGILFPPVQQDSFGDLVRYKLNVTQSKLVSQDVLCKDVEFPRFNQDYATKSTCTIVYGCELKGFTEKSDETIQLIKTNTETGVVSRYGQEGFSCSEPIFVPKPNATKEDDGVLLTLVNNFDCCYLIIVDAENMTELARFAIGKFTAVTFHGSFVDYEFKSININ